MSPRVFYRGRLRLPEGFHTGDGRRLGVADQPLFRDAGGEVALAGTSLAGVLRSDLARLLAHSAGPPDRCRHEPDCLCVVCRLMGPEAKTTRGGEEEESRLRASKLHVSGGGAISPQETRIRDHVGMDRRTHTAAAKRKYDVEVLEGPVELPFELRLDDPEEDETLYLEAALRRLAGGWLFLGGKSSSGLGRAELVHLARYRLDLSRVDRLVEHLLGDETTAGCREEVLISRPSDPWAQGWELAPAPEAGPWGQIRLHLELHFPWGFLVNAPPDALEQGFDHAYARGPDGEPFLPGSALRGALRSRGEQILRTLAGDRGACELNRRHQACHERMDLESRERAAKRREPLSFREELERHCPACRVFGSGRLASAFKVSDFRPVAGGRGAPFAQDFVAVDRFTGGAAPGAKFDSLSAAGVTLRGTLQLEIGEHRLQAWGLGLLALVLRDLLLGDVPLGFGSAKGFNEYGARITGIDRFWLQPPAPLAGLPLGAEAGSATWRPEPGVPLDRPAAVQQAGGQQVAKHLGAWVQALHHHLAALPQATGPDSSGPSDPAARTTQAGSPEPGTPHKNGGKSPHGES